MSPVPEALELQLRTMSEGNAREHPMSRHRRRKAQRSAVAMAWPYQWRQRKWRFPLQVTLERHAPSSGLDVGDNLPASLKAVRDEVAKQLGVDDRDSRVCWVYAQARGSYCVVIGVEEMSP